MEEELRKLREDAAENKVLEAGTARDAEIEVATRAHLAEFKTWIAENEPEPPEKRARLLQQDYNPLLYGYWAYKYWHPEHTFDAAAMIQHYLDWPPDKSTRNHLLVIEKIIPGNSLDIVRLPPQAVVVGAGDIFEAEDLVAFAVVDAVSCSLSRFLGLGLVYGLALDLFPHQINFLHQTLSKVPNVPCLDVYRQSLLPYLLMNVAIALLL